MPNDQQPKLWTEDNLTEPAWWGYLRVLTGVLWVIAVAIVVWKVS